ncbi:bestrophin-4-like [Metopolophium dirhodum]|uniref:bestrophin-4-like n=1 Tax=Metopolophium dirhodum TaxID=44670 RepID=UPI00298F92B4|nr:bestrophin-4-like [Metopolophium dirhodum]XP_060858258.1 bestrophin-4-like [Metopolophium dirhodum]XP_060858259.1 bestrophin-4-like [Metopolophium dirhodum]XP_060858260.1 bestrophin-4-like [Metopolophium dirhodum]XP_060858261.1 bestrophin-4-like [Metopolophium dirhodum]XP_060858262.1 bestrophin-4-like [Metopolophium dirhodum]
MTVTYTAEVATCRGFGCFLKLLLRWRGSIYKLVWPDLAAFLVCYYTLNLTYRFVLNQQQKRVFESISDYCETYSDLIPLSFVLGFYISIIMQRWWDQYCSIPWPDPIAVYVSSHIHGQDERGRLMRRTIMRYVCLGLTMVFSNISPRVKKRFPTLDHFVEAGLLLENEKTIVLDLNDKFPRHSKHWLPVVWAASIVTRARKEGRIRDDFAVKTIIDELNKFRGQCGLLLNYDSISVPLVYTQVVTLAVYSFFITTVMGRQWLDKPVVPLANLKHQTETNPANYNYIDLYFPVFTTLQFFFYMGWLKVAESLINPFGEDDDDFEVNWIIDRNVQVSYLIVDEMHHEHPELIRDQYWDQVFPTELPYTVAAGERERHPEPSTANIAVSDADAEYSLPPKGCDDGQAIDDDDANSGIHFVATAGSYKRSNSLLRGRPISSHSSNDHHHHLNNQSVASSLNRVGSVTSILKNLFKRTGGTSAQLGGDGLLSRVSSSNRLPGSSWQSQESLQSSSSKLLQQQFGSVRIADQVIEELDEQMTITAGGRLERRSEKPNVRTVFPPQPPLPNDSASSNLSNITYTEVLSTNDDFGYQDGKQEDTLMRSDSDSSNHHTPSTSSLLFVVEPVVSQSATINNEVPNSRTSSVNYDYETSRRTPDHHD